MDFALPYLVVRFFYRITEFVRHWYVVGTYAYFDFVLGTLRRMDQTLAWRITLTYLFRPLYGDYSFIGRTIGFIFRIFRLIFGGIIYLVAFALAALVYVLWVAFPPYLLYRIFF